MPEATHRETSGISVDADHLGVELDVNVEWRQFFDRMSDPDVNYQFWAGLRYMFK